MGPKANATNSRHGLRRQDVSEGTCPPPGFSKLPPGSSWLLSLGTGYCQEPGGARRSQGGPEGAKQELNECMLHVSKGSSPHRPWPSLASPSNPLARQVQIAYLKWQYPPPFPGLHWLLQAPPGFSWCLSLGKGCCQEPGEARGEALSLTPSSACATDSTNCYHECGSCCFHCAFNFPSTGATGRSSSINTTLLLFLLLLLLVVILLLPLLLLDFYCCYNFCSLLVPCRTGCMRGGCENKLARSW